jgi:hypothetical protein
VRQIGITEQTYYRWRREYGGMDVSLARRPKDREREIQRLKKLVADQAHDISILTEVNRGNFRVRRVDGSISQQDRQNTKDTPITGPSTDTRVSSSPSPSPSVRS